MSAVANTVNSQANTIHHLPYFAFGKLECKAGTFFIRQLLPSDTPCVEAFFRNQRIKLTERVQQVFNNAIQNHPFSIYTVQSEKNEIGALLFLDPDTTNSELQVRICVDATLQKKELGTNIWGWMVKQLFPLLILNQVTLGPKPFVEGTVVLRKIPDFLAEKAIRAGFVHDAGAMTHKIAVEKLNSTSFEMVEAETIKPEEAKKEEPKGWLGSWWS